MQLHKPKPDKAEASATARRALWRVSRGRRPERRLSAYINSANINFSMIHNNFTVSAVRDACDFEYVFDFHRLSRCGLARVCIGSRLIGSTQWISVLHS